MSIPNVDFMSAARSSAVVTGGRGVSAHRYQTSSRVSDLSISGSFSSANAASLFARASSLAWMKRTNSCAASSCEPASLSAAARRRARQDLRLERDGLAVEQDRLVAIAGLRERGAAVEEHAERAGAVLLLDEHLREPAVAALGTGKFFARYGTALPLTEPPAWSFFRPSASATL